MALADIRETYAGSVAATVIVELLHPHRQQGDFSQEWHDTINSFVVCRGNFRGGTGILGTVLLVDGDVFFTGRDSSNRKASMAGPGLRSGSDIKPTNQFWRVLVGKMG